MIIRMLRTISKNIKLSCRFLSNIRKRDVPIIGTDQLSANNALNEAQNKYVSFYDNYSETSFSELDVDTFIKMVKQAKTPSKEGHHLILLEDINSIQNAIHAETKMISLFFTKREMLEKISVSESCSFAQIYHTNYKNFEEVSDLDEPTYIMAIFERSVPEHPKPVPLTLILDRISEPNNIANILITASAFHIDRILLTAGCVNIFNRKLSNDAQSVLLRTPIFTKLTWSAVRDSLRDNCTLFYADTLHSYFPNTTAGHRSNAVPYFHHQFIDFTGHKTYGLIIGGETRGLSDDAKSLAYDTGGSAIVIPLIPKINSLNCAVASAILMSEFSRVFHEAK